MAVTCASLSGNVVGASCRNSSAAIQGDLVLINWEDWEAAKADSSLVTYSNGVYSKITLPTGKNGVHVTSHDKAFSAMYELVTGTYVNAFRHGVTMRVFEKTQAIKTFLSKIGYGRFVAIVRNLDSNNEETKFEVYGGEKGLVASANSFDSTNTDGVIGELTIQSADDALESAVPDSFYVTDLETTIEAYEALYPTA